MTAAIPPQEIPEEERCHYQSDSSESAPPVDSVQGPKKKNKKKKKKKSASAPAQQGANGTPLNVLKISRAKHWKYISSYHGQWLQLPNELLQTLLQINCGARQTDGFDAHPEDERNASGHPLPPPLDSAVFRGVLEVRSLVESASDLSIRAASGLSAAARGSFNNPNDFVNDPFFGGGGTQGRGGRATPMSATSQARLRNLAVAKLAQAYRIDEVAASVAVMQGSTALDDLAERVLRQEPGHPDARYVQFFHEKIPSRTLAQSTDTTVLDGLISQFPNQLAYYRTKGVVYSFQHRFADAIDTFTQGLAIARSQRKALSTVSNSRSRKSAKGKRKTSHNASPHSEEDVDTDDIEVQDPWSRPAIDEAASIGLTPGDDCERQLLFLRGMAYFNWACSALEDCVMRIEGAPRPKEGLLNEGGEATLEGLGIHGAQSSGLLGGSRTKLASRWPRYHAAFNELAFHDHVLTLFQLSAKDHERFLSYFPIFRPEPGSALSGTEKKPNINNRPRKDDKLSPHARRMVQHRSLEGRTRYTHPQANHDRSDATLLTTYHPLLVEAHFTHLLCDMMMGNFQSSLSKHYQLATLMSGLEGFPVFLLARSMSQTQYSELLERIAVTWLTDRENNGISPPEGTEEEIAAQGPLQSLHHLASFFTPTHGALLAAAAENERDKGTRGHTGKAPLAIMDHQSNDASNHSSNPDAELRHLTLARAEIAAAWLQTVFLQAALPAEPPTSSSAGTSSSNVA